MSQKFSHFQILEKIDAGGMGEIYRARDTKLRRTVAVKFLAADLVGDLEARRRFIQEARAASSLDHPNICTIHEVGETPEGRIFIAMACYDGETLKQRLARGTIPFPEALEIVTQVCRGLAKAHASGIVHRDIKPANVMITREGVVKILDFGLAKLTSQTAITKRLRTMGTVAYMSPEQLTGKPVDHRSDIWSAGVMLYEMLTGVPPFRGEIEQAVIYSILNTSPFPVVSGREEMPANAEEILKKCLEKDPNDRFQTVERFQDELHQTCGGSAGEWRSRRSGKLAVSARVRSFIKGRQRLISTGLPIILVLIMAGIFVKKSLMEKSRKPMRIVPFTHYLGLERYPSFSPDGRLLAFTSNRDSPSQSNVYVKLIGAGEPLRLTSHPGMDVSPVWSPDGRFILFGRMLCDEEDEGIWRVPSLGGTPEKIIDMKWYMYWIGRNMSWSPDGRLLAYPRLDPGTDRRSIYLYSFETRQSRKCTSPPDYFIGDLHVAFSHDGSRLAYIRQKSFYRCNIFTLNLKSGIEKRLTSDYCGIETLAWGKGDHEILFTSDRSGNQELWKIRSDGGTVQRVSINGVGKFVAVSAAGDQLAFSSLYRNWPKIYRIDYPINDTRLARPRTIVESTRRSWAADISPDGRKILFSSNRSEFDQIWVCDTDGKNPVQLTHDPLKTIGNPHWSPDGQTIVFDAWSSSSSDIYLMKPNGDSTVVFVEGPADEGCPIWSRDGRSIYFSSDRTGRLQIWKKKLGGGEPVQVTRNGGKIAFESFDGRSIYYYKMDEPGIWMADITGAGPEHILDEPKWYGAWTLSQDGIYYVSEGPNGSNPIYFYSFATQKTVPLLDTGTLPMLYLTIAPDRSYFLLSDNSCDDEDIYLVENF